MSDWTHRQCEACWGSTYGENGRQPTRIKPEFAKTASCCFCGTETNSGIYVRYNPAELPNCIGHDRD